MKLHTIAVVLSSTLALGACGKANDTPAIRVEAEGMFRNYQVRLDHLNSRADSIMQRGNAIGVTNPDAANASRLFATAKSKLEQLKGDLAAAPNEMPKLKDRLELVKYFDRKKQDLRTSFIQVNADFDAVESWITLAESQTQVASRQPVVPPPTPNRDVQPPGIPGTTGAGGTPPNQ
ncbi:MAG: hypothetical protein M4D80_17035 [Myxococcota bacterium]|nr:hypothetical protein [Myxococcota bacterium]